MQNKITQIEDLIHSDRGNRGLGSIWNDLKLAKDKRLYQLYDACTILAKSTSVLVFLNFFVQKITGFYILRAQAAETDGPPGALAICRALLAAGKRATLVVDQWSSKCLNQMIQEEAKLNSSISSVDVIEFPLGDLDLALKFAKDLIEHKQVDCLVSIECPSVTNDNTYRNMRAMDITQCSPKRDALFSIAQQSTGISTIGIGDGGNEIGMANLSELVAKHVPHGAEICSKISCDALISAGVSNWGGYAIAAAMYILDATKPTNMLPSPELEQMHMKIMFDAGLVDGPTASVAMSVDGIPFDEHSKLIQSIVQIALGN